MTRYVTTEELCAKSGLSLADLWELEETGLLRSTRVLPAPEYRPRLVTWACKLAYLRREGWTLEEIGAWARGRWTTGSPGEWPPDQQLWNPKD